MKPDLKEENKLWEKGFEFVAGLDEAGRGPLAGPVVAAAVVLKFKNLDLSKNLFNSACNKIGNYLGNYFTNDGYINYMQEKYNLTEQQNYNLQLFMNSKFRFKIMRKQYNA